MVWKRRIILPDKQPINHRLYRRPRAHIQRHNCIRRLVWHQRELAALLCFGLHSKDLIMEVPGEIDPVKYGVLWQKVQDMDKKMDKMERQMEQLIDMASRSKGALWLGIGLWSVLTAVVGFFLGKH